MLPFFPRTRDRVSLHRGTNSAAASIPALRLPAIPRWLSSDKCTPWRSSKARCKRSSVHNSWGYPSVLGFWVARAIKALRTSGLWVGCRPGRGWSSNPGSPFSLNRLTHFGPIALLLKPALKPASVACRSGSSYIKAITRARCTRRMDLCEMKLTA